MASIEKLNHGSFVIDMVDLVHKNPSDMSKRYYKLDKKQAIERIKWCRKNFGERGDGWDFSHNELCIWSSPLITMYELWHV